MLHLIATPIGNLADITLRSLETLRSCDYILCEDTRRSLKLLSHYQIQKPLKSYHKFNERRRTEEVIADLKAGMQIALITDAGTPGISDPGELLMKRCVEENLEVTALPGACAAIVALTLSGLPTERFQMVGFLPRKKSHIRRAFTECLEYPGTSIFYESPFRILSTLKILAEVAPACRVAVARELTKLHEECVRGTPKELLAHFSTHSTKGEFVLLVRALGF